MLVESKSSINLDRSSHVAFHVIHLLVAEFVITHATRVPLHNIGRVLSCIVELMLASIAIFVVAKLAIFRGFQLLLAPKSLCSFQSVDLSEPSNHNRVLLEIIEWIDEKFLLQSSNIRCQTKLILTFWYRFLLKRPVIVCPFA